MVIQNKQKKSVNLRPFYIFFDKIDFMQVIPMILLLTIGVLFIYSTGEQNGNQYAKMFWKLQLLWIGIGFGIWLIFALIDYRFLKHWCWLIYLISIILLVTVLFFGVERYGATRWLQIWKIRMQPSELGKIGVFLMVAWVLSFKTFDVNKLSHMAVIGAICLVPFVLILKEPDLGTALVLVPVTALMVFIARLKWQWIFVAIIITCLAVPVAFLNMKDYQKQRIMDLLFPSRNPTGSSWSTIQCELAVGSGGMWGKGYMQGTQSVLGFVPKTVANSDFIFSVIAEETGFVGATTLISLYFILIASAIRTAWVSRDKFGRYLAVAIAGMIFAHTCVNIGMSIRLMPITGLPLPLVSYGGSFIVNMMLCLGILQSIYARRKRENEE